jgi:hypothetical protein
VLAGTLTFTTPAEGDIFNSASDMKVRWFSPATLNFTVEYSLDNGASWSYISANVASAAGNTEWSIPAIPTTTTEALVRATWNGQDDMVYGVSGKFTIQTTSSVEEETGEFAVEAAYPNPFEEETTVNFFLPESGTVTVEMFDTKGSMISTVIAGEFMAQGDNRVVVEAGDLSAGVYYIQITNGDNQQMQEVIIK